MAAKKAITLEVSDRSLRKKKVGKLRRQGIIPGIIHGKDFEPLHVQVDERVFEQVYKKSHGTSLVNLKLDDKTIQVLIHTIQKDKLSHAVRHVEFLKIDPKRQVTVEVPLIFVGVSPGEKDGMGKVTHEETSIHLKCSPSNIPHEIEVDISGIKDKHDAIRASDLKLPDGVTLGHGVSEKKVIATLVSTRIVEPVVAAPEEIEEAAEAPGEEKPAED